MTENSRKPRDPTDMDHPLYDPTEDSTHPFYEARKTEAEPASSGEDGYKVGPGFPPKQHTWNKGCPSPNPKGRPKKIPSMKPDLKKILESALNETVTITDKNKKRVLSKFAVGIQQLVNGFAKGDRHCRRDLFQYAPLLGVELQAKEAIEEALGINDQEIVDAYLRRHLPTSTEASPEVRVKAPPDLVDDDVPSADSIEQAAPAPPPRPTKMPIEPVFDENGVARPVSDSRYIRTQNERRLAWEKKQSES